MIRRRFLLRGVWIGALILIGAQLVLWAVSGVGTLDDQFYRDEVTAFASASVAGVTKSDKILVCEARRSSLSKSTLEATASQLEDAGLEWLSAGDIAPIGKVDPGECNCFALCYDVVLTSPVVGIVEATFRPTLTSADSGRRYLYFFLGSHWTRLIEYGGWEQ